VISYDAIITCEQRITKLDWNLGMHGTVQIDFAIPAEKKGCGIDGQGRKETAPPNAYFS